MIAIPGDSLSIRADVVYLNSQKLTEPYVAQHSSRPENFPELIVSKGEVVAFEGFALAELPDYLKATLVMLERLPQDILDFPAPKMLNHMNGHYFVGVVVLKAGEGMQIANHIR